MRPEKSSKRKLRRKWSCYDMVTPRVTPITHLDVEPKPGRGLPAEDPQWRIDDVGSMAGKAQGLEHLKG
jgi:hypothetical protein